MLHLARSCTMNRVTWDHTITPFTIHDIHDFILGEILACFTMIYLRLVKHG